MNRIAAPIITLVWPTLSTQIPTNGTASVCSAAALTAAVNPIDCGRLSSRMAILFMVTAYPAFVLLGAAPSLGVLIAMVCWISLLKSFFSGALPSLMAKTFPVTTRVSGMSLSYNISGCIGF